jgi:hypothetical protein
MGTMRQFAHTPSAQRTRDVERFLAAFDGARDIHFDVEWSHWLARTIPGTKRRVEFAGARIFFPEERSAEFNAELRAFWTLSS